MTDRFWAKERISGNNHIWTGIDTQTDEVVAMKLAPIEGNSDYDTLNDHVRMEAQVMQTLNGLSDRIVRFIAFYQNSEREYVLVMEKAVCSLQDVLDVHGHLTEFQAQVAIRAILEGLVVCHDHYFVHRDIKPANCFLFAHDFNSLKLGDFGVTAEDNGYSCCGGIKGTKGYMAPEILRKEQYGRPVDLYSTGCLLLTLFDNKPPSALASDFFHKLKHPDPAARPTAAQALQHPWITCIEENASAPFTMKPILHPHAVDGYPEWLLLVPENTKLKPYYFNQQTGVTQWNHPNGMISPTPENERVGSAQSEHHHGESGIEDFIKNKVQPKMHETIESVKPKFQNLVHRVAAFKKWGK
ncbi:hypothetical protein CcCBS67573_g05328 [Chytriomyces confervae]|uniref:Protein kinase domain-containing protein n=1 Tax=Chytriomyces confervae TaxID=246404 RepID=A0A507FAV2_9FUNG|nr:Calcium-dependent protein kinase 14 [Chytriomyces hyalinus]TPX73403.1 hypothetical protein CcCBS67573_g05328 [Chytriomyces confervae]